MSDKNFKAVRKQIRNVVQENLGDLVKTELYMSMYEGLKKDMLFQLETIQADVNKTLAQMEERSKDVQAFIMNQIQSELAKTAPKVDISLDNTSTTLEPTQESQQA